MTLDVYADLFDDDLTAVADKLDESVGTGGAYGWLADSKSRLTAVPRHVEPPVRIEL
jgi:hypothetical protein